MATLVSKDKCTGCLACYNSCPSKAIKIVQDEQGFWCPEIVVEKCIDCHLCEKMCPPLNEYDRRKEPISVYAAWRRSDQKRLLSNSGGIAASLAEYALANNFIVVGAVIDDDLTVKHCICENIEDLNKLRMSKYVQSYIGDIYCRLRERIQAGKKVLFFGTPCQVDAIKRVIGDGFSRSLITVDLICHGVPSPQYLKEHLDSYVANIEDITSYAFRDNDQYKFRVFLRDGKILEFPKEKDSYLYAFLKNVLDRESCHTCKYSSTSRVADITIGDFWGFTKSENEAIKVEPHKGISAVLVNTEQGQEVFEVIKSDLYVEERELDEVVKYNPFLREIRGSNSDRFGFRIMVSAKGFESAVKSLKRRYFIKDKADYIYKWVKYKMLKLFKLLKR